jgi:hypothetical protein
LLSRRREKAYPKPPRLVSRKGLRFPAIVQTSKNFKKDTVPEKTPRYSLLLPRWAALAIPVPVK